MDNLPGKVARAFKEDSEDVVTLVTVIDLYCSQVNREGTRAQKEAFLEALFCQLTLNKEVLAKIAWDLPKSLLNFIVIENVDTDKALLKSKVFRLVVKCFNEISLHGNAKECFLTGCEILSKLKRDNLELEDDNAEADEKVETSASLLSSIELSDGTEEARSEDFVAEAIKLPHEKTENKSEDIPRHLRDDFVAPPLERGVEEFILELRLHVVLEMVTTTLKRIHTLYPSRFLGMAVGSLFAFGRSNADQIDDSVFVLRRVFAFARGYIPPQPTQEVIRDIPKDDYNKIVEDENCLQRKLLRSLITTSLNLFLKKSELHVAEALFAQIKNLQFEPDSLWTVVNGISSRYFQLALSFDIDLEKEFVTRCIEESKRIYQSLPKDSEIVNDNARKAIGQVIYQLAYTYNLQKLANEKDLSLDAGSILILSASHFLEKNKPLYPGIKIDDCIYMYLRFVTPAMFSQAYDHDFMVDVCHYWILTAVLNVPCHENRKILSKLPSYLNVIFLQILLLKATTPAGGKQRMVLLTTLTRVLCLMPENITFDFAVDTLLSCPFPHIKCCMLGILKDLMINTRPHESDVTDALSTLSIKDDASDKKAPPVPPRPFLVITEDRMAAIHSLALLALKSLKQSPSKETSTLMLTYLNFLSGLRMKWDLIFLGEIVKELSQFLQEEESELSELEFLRIANSDLIAFLEEETKA
ncbi:LAMI_0G08922g1_1 [Lachancea mirantina]|uniref:LAMI_0G08922g1_1 n=1 Tax=Lachancea mirantina TaxID=1230905 RepID=A0A1G4KA28_9SACH|nr:LAMI_0G08922g1_1 [Lachancea mirantina]